jgi:D-sedoheptulose 7-phosphate isomerase
VCNDTNPALIFAQLVWALGQAGDTLICLSTSGNSRNVVLAAKAARAKGMAVLALTGEADSLLSTLADVTVQVPACDTYRVQEYHLPVYHYLCAAVEEALFDGGNP